MAPRFSVLLPTHNRADVVPFAIRSVLSQTEGDFELLVVADGCSDRTTEVVAGFSDPRVRLFDLPKAPFFGYANRNIALREAKGHYVAYMAHDDLIFPDHLSLLGETLDQSQAEWAYSRPLWVSPGGVVVPFAVNLHNSEELSFFLTQANSIPASCVVHLRSCFERYGYWPEDITQAADWHYWIRVIEGGKRNNFAFCATPSVLHFRAIWKTGTAYDPAPMPILIELAATKEWWPSSLREPVLEYGSEQAEFYRRMENGGPTWVIRLRADVDLVVDHLAWRHGLDLPKYCAVLSERDALRDDLANARCRICSLEEEREAFQRSADVLRRLGALRRKLAPPFSLRERLWYWIRRQALQM